MAGQSPSFVAEADVNASVFVKHGTDDFNVVTADAGARIIGVTHEGSRDAPIPGVTPKAAAAGESVRVYGMGETCEVLAGAAVTHGDYVKADANGKAIPAATGDEYGGRALADAAAADVRLRVQLMYGELD